MNQSRGDFHREVLDYLSYQGLKKRTAEIHIRHLHGLFEWCNKRETDFNPLSITAFLQGLDPHAAKRAHSVLSRFFTWRILSGSAESSPMAKVQRPTAVTKPVRGLLRADLVSIWDQVEKDLLVNNSIHVFGAMRMKATLMLVIFYGLRIGEIIDLDQRHWSRRAGVLHVKRKGGRVVVVNLDPDVNDFLIRYDAAARSRKHGPEPAIFVTWKGQRLNHAAVLRQFSKLCARAGVDLWRGGLHQLRHTMAGIMLEDGENLQDISSYLGHTNLSSTDHYLRQHFGVKTQAGRTIFERLLSQAPGAEVIPFNPKEKDISF